MWFWILVQNLETKVKKIGFRSKKRLTSIRIWKLCGNFEQWCDGQCFWIHKSFLFLSFLGGILECFVWKSIKKPLENGERGPNLCWKCFQKCFFSRIMHDFLFLRNKTVLIFLLRRNFENNETVFLVSYYYSSFFFFKTWIKIFIWLYSKYNLKTLNI